MYRLLDGHQTYTTIQAFFLAMVLNPAVQAKAQAQIDSVLGTDRLPVFEDLSSLPYIQAIMMEVLRYYPVTPFSTCDDNVHIYQVFC